MKSIYLKKGMTLIEIIIVIAILGIIMIAMSSFQLGILNNNRFSQDSLTSLQDAKTILRTMIKEMRTIAPSNNGSFAIINVATSTISFYSDIDGDAIKEQLRYFLVSTTLKKGVIKPSGSPLVYNPANENISILANNIKNSTSTMLFEYYNENYTGTSSPLTYPINLSDIHLIKVNLMIDVDPNRSPVPRLYTSQVNLRNLKNNL